ncbi:mCG148114 [Mus musculus]|nr:mCG148114 [Mus musculus]
MRRQQAALCFRTRTRETTGCNRSFLGKGRYKPTDNADTAFNRPRRCSLRSWGLLVSVLPNIQTVSSAGK